MLPSLKRSLARLAKTKARLLRSVEGWTPGQLLEKPAPDKWSAAQVIDHMARVELGFLEAVKTNLPSPRPLTANDRIGSLIVRAVMRSRMRVKMPAEAEAIVPAANPNMNDALRAWERSQKAWAEFLETVHAQGLKGGVFFHSRAGWMNLRSALKLLRLHHKHHRVQFQRIAAAIHR